MKNLFNELQKNLLAGQDCVLVSILADKGSAPRGLGAHMLVNSSGRVTGTIGGGAVEHHAIQLAVEAIGQGQSFVKEYRLSADLGMICGGNVTVLYQFIAANNADMRRLCADALRLFAANADMWLIIRQKDDGEWHMSITDRKKNAEGLALHLNSAGRVLIFGAGHVAQALVPVLATLNFNCWVMDNRPELVKEELFPDAKKVSLGDYERLAEYTQIYADDYVVVMTHGHVADYTVQKQAMQAKPLYIGVIGSRSKVKTVAAKLAADGFSAEEIAAVHSPIGIAIKAETPEEIAISIAAELIQIRAEKMGK